MKYSSAENPCTEERISQCNYDNHQNTCNRFIGPENIRLCNSIQFNQIQTIQHRIFSIEETALRKCWTSVKGYGQTGQVPTWP